MVVRRAAFAKEQKLELAGYLSLRDKLTDKQLAVRFGRSESGMRSIIRRMRQKLSQSR